MCALVDVVVCITVACERGVAVAIRGRVCDAQNQFLAQVAAGPVRLWGPSVLAAAIAEPSH
jgi:hypothetical protein